LHPFRELLLGEDEGGKDATEIFHNYRVGTSLLQAERLISFDRELRMLVLDGLERVEVSLRMRLGHVLGEISAFAHEDPSNFVSSFTQESKNQLSGATEPSAHQSWLERVKDRKDGSDEAFVMHFRTKYLGRMPIWALTEILELGHLSRLYRGMNNSLATRVAQDYGAPSKKVMVSWIASLNYVRNVSAHHARLFNRKLVAAPARPSLGMVTLLDHLRQAVTAKEVFGLYTALAVIAFLLKSIEPGGNWSSRMVSLLRSFPHRTGLSLRAIGVPHDWDSLELWKH